MRTVFCLLFFVTTSVGCGDRPEAEPSLPTAQTDTSTPASGADRESFGTMWRSSDDVARQKMANLANVAPLFQGALKTEVETALGSPSFAGVDQFGEDVMKYELGAMPQDMGGGQYHLTFVFQKDAVVRVMGNSITF